MLKNKYMKLLKFIKKLIPFKGKEFSSFKNRTKLFLTLGLCVNVAFAFYNIFTGVLYRSVWFGGVAIYYIMLCVMKFFLILRGFGRSKEDIKEVYDFRICSIMLLTLNLTITGLIFQMVWQNKAHLYSQTVILGTIIFTVFRLIAAITDTIRLRRFFTPTLYAAKSLTLSVALMSFFSLSTALLDRAKITPNFKRGINILSGSVVGIVVTIIALKALLKAEKLIKNK